MRKRAKDAEWNAWNAGDAAGGVRCRRVRDGIPMTASLPSSAAESPRRTIDPDAPARRANDAELTAQCQTDLTMPEDAVDELSTAEEPAAAAKFDEILDGGKLY